MSAAPMRTSSTAGTPSRPGVGRWVNPFADARYVRSPITAAELAAVGHILDRNGVTALRRGAKSTNPDHVAVRRLIEPLADVARHMVRQRRDEDGPVAHELVPRAARADRRRREARRETEYARCLIQSILRETRQRHACFWEWSAETWAEVIRAARPDDRFRLCAAAYLLLDLNLHGRVAGAITRIELARVIFGARAVNDARERVGAVLARWGYTGTPTEYCAPLVWAMLDVRSPRLEDVSVEALAAVRDDPAAPAHVQMDTYLVSRALADLGVIAQALPQRWSTPPKVGVTEDHRVGVADGWAAAVERWYHTSTRPEKSRKYARNFLMRVGRWQTAAFPTITSPAEWTVEVAASFIAAVDRAVTGSWSAHHYPAPLKGKPLTAAAKIHMIDAVRGFFRDLKRWKMLEGCEVDPPHDLATPLAMRRLVGPDPRDIRDQVWTKIVHASLTLTDAQLAEHANGQPKTRYPAAMVRALAVLWTHGGLRSDEIRRLRVGCIRDVPAGTDPALSAELGKDVAEVVCHLHVPVNKTNTEFTKTVPKIVGDLIARWEAVRPTQPPGVDPKTRERVHFLFSNRAKPVSKHFINKVLIPMLCARAGVPLEDVPGKRITSHRARASEASRLYNSEEGMTLEELHKWLGHASLASTEYYVRSSPRKQMRSYAKAHASARWVEVLIDDDAVTSGRAAAGEAWRYYPLGNGDFCKNAYYEACKHRLACARCDDYVPADGALARALRTKADLQRMLVEMPLSEEERHAVEDGVDVFKRFVDKLQDVPTPSGQTPRELAARTRPPDAATPAPAEPGTGTLRGRKPGRSLPVIPAPRPRAPGSEDLG